ncbi:DEAD/DEAH box helicase [Subtercola lobariae]|uniref:DEAD/DEAH box helicase n=2 Tax=Subtercola lobariae TaxID=1588641 RepID=A0A917EWW4_9MICO|nr:DEAD/DEAH box helicase [Subtercola lobariae]
MWFRRRDEADLILKMNTGSGKTVVGLVIAKSSLNEDKGPAVYLVPNTQLQEQVGITASELGIAWTDDPADPAFRQSEAVLVVPVHTMYNGRSRFRLEGHGNTVHVGTVIVDDAHACIPIIEDQFSTTLADTTPAYKGLLKRFNSVLKEQSLSGWTSITTGSETQAVPIPYWAWANELASSYALLNAVTETDSKDHQFKWPLMRNQLALCDVAFTSKEVEVRLPYPNLAVIPSFTNAARRIYMTATLADDGILVTKMGVDPNCVTRPIAPSSASDIGDRIILTPVETSRMVTIEDVKASAANWATSLNVVVIVPSRHRANEWQPYTSEIHEKTTIKAIVKRLNTQHVGLVVLIARYDGVDLPGDACRVLIIDGLPERYSPAELVEAAAIGGTEVMSSQQTQRIEQGMGRGVRATDDYCAVILLDPRLVGRLYSAADLHQLSPGTRAQYELSATFAKSGRSKPMSFFADAVDAFLARDSAWTNASKDAVEGLTYSSLSSVQPLLVAERDAFREACAERYTQAFELLQAQFSSISNARYRGWIKQRAASYLELVDPVKAREIQVKARIDNNYILKVPTSTAEPKLSHLGNQADAASAHLGQYAKPRDLEVVVDGILFDLVPSTDKNSHKRFEAALDIVGKMLGFNASRPDATTGIGPDNLWAIGQDSYWVIECKSEAVASQVSREYLEQLTHSADWFESQYDISQHPYLPLLIHPSRTPMWDAVPRQTARVMSFDLLAEFRIAVRGYITALCSTDSYRDPSEISKNLNHFGFAARDLANRWTQTFRAPAKR